MANSAVKIRSYNREEQIEYIGRARVHSLLGSQHYGVLEAVLSKQEEELVEVNTPWGEHFASVFKRAAGIHAYR